MQRAPGIPCALFSRGSLSRKPRAHRAARMRSFVVNTNTPPSQPSSPGLTGRPSIPETPLMDSRSRGVLDTPHARGMTTVRTEQRSDEAVRCPCCPGCGSFHTGEFLVEVERLHFRRERQALAPSCDTERISALPGRDAPALYRSTKSCSNYRQQADTSSGRSWGRNCHEARHRHRGNHEARGN